MDNRPGPGRNRPRGIRFRLVSPSQEGPQWRRFRGGARRGRGAPRLHPGVWCERQRA
uniref:BTB/POZ domain-containing protein At2g04740 n=1 Tax=Rhizophora mucronata TaxID=61149 RepID=A0A2P2JAR4_RHIMU